MDVMDEQVSQETIQQTIDTSLLNEMKEFTEEQLLNVRKKVSKLLFDGPGLIPNDLPKETYFEVFPRQVEKVSC